MEAKDTVMKEIKFIWICRNLHFNEIHRVELTDIMLLNDSYPLWIKSDNCEIIAKYMVDANEADIKAEALKAGEQQGIEKGKKIAVEFIESYLVTTVHPEGDMHHIDDKEWQLVKLKLLRQTNLKEGLEK